MASGMASSWLFMFCVGEPRFRMTLALDVKVLFSLTELVDLKAAKAKIWISWKTSSEKDNK